MLMKINKVELKGIDININSKFILVHENRISDISESVQLTEKM